MNQDNNSNDKAAELQIDSATPSPALHSSKRGSEKVQRQLLMPEDSAAKKRKDPATKKYPVLSSTEEDMLLASAPTSNTCSQDGLDLMLSNSEEDKLLASPAPSNGSSQDDLDSLEDTYAAKKSEKEQCPGCRKNLTRRTIKKHQVEGCPKKKKKGKCPGCRRMLTLETLEKHKQRNCSNYRKDFGPQSEPKAEESLILEDRCGKSLEKEQNGSEVGMSEDGDGNVKSSEECETLR